MFEEPAVPQNLVIILIYFKKVFLLCFVFLKNYSVELVFTHFADALK